MLKVVDTHFQKLTQFEFRLIAKVDKGTNSERTRSTAENTNSVSERTAASKEVDKNLINMEDSKQMAENQSQVEKGRAEHPL